MGYKGFTTVDSDGHVVEPWSLYTTYTDEPFRERAQALVERGRQVGVATVLNELQTGRYWQSRQLPQRAQEQWQTAAQNIDL